MPEFVVVTTDKIGVFAGQLDARDGDSIILKDGQMCVYWSRDVRGVVGLAATGPTKDCRVTKAATKIELNGVTSVMTCTDAARKAWEAEPWS